MAAISGYGKTSSAAKRNRAGVLVPAVLVAVAGVVLAR